MPFAQAVNRSEPGPAPNGWAAQRTAWLLFAPPAFVVAVRWILQLIDDRQNATPALSLAPVSTTAGALDLLWPAALTLAMVVAAGLVIRRLGWRRVMPVIGTVWLLAWLAGGSALVARHVNRQGLFLQGVTAIAPSPGNLVMARVVTRQSKPASLRSLGGTELVLQVGGMAIPQRLLIGDASATLLKPGDLLALHVAPGRFSGLFVTGWQVAPSVSLLIKIP